MNRRGIIASLATAAILSSALGAFTAPVASAGEGSVCDAGIFTITKTDANDSTKLLPGATFVVKLADHVVGLAGDQSPKAADYKDAFDAAAASYWDTTPGKAWKAASQESLGTDQNEASYPVDITGLTNAAVQNASMANWQADGDGSVATFKADVQRRLDAINAALDANPDLESIDKATYDTAVANRDKLQTVLDATNKALTESDFTKFSTAYKTMVNADNWVYGLIVDPSIEYQDHVAGNNFADLNAAGAAAIGATNTITVTTGADGTAQVTIFGIKDTYSDSVTRGDTSCGQLVGDLQESVAPNGYLLDESVKTGAVAVSTLADGAKGEVTITNLKWDAPKPKPPVRTETGM